MCRINPNLKAHKVVDFLSVNTMGLIEGYMVVKASLSLSLKKKKKKKKKKVWPMQYFKASETNWTAWNNLAYNTHCVDFLVKIVTSHMGLSWSFP